LRLLDHAHDLSTMVNLALKRRPAGRNGKEQDQEIA
jgi:hypothetical protein